MTVKINGSTLTPQPRDVAWGNEIVGDKLDGTQSLGAYRPLSLRAPTVHGTASDFNWSNFENAVHTSIDVQAPGETGVSGSTVNYSSGVIAKAIRSLTGEPGDLLAAGIELELLVVV